MTEATLTREQIVAAFKRGDHVEGEVSISLDELVADDDSWSNLMDLASERLVGSDLLMDISINPVKVNDDGSIVFRVSGDAQMVVESDDLDEDEEGDKDKS